jgi:phosphoenolpyruvate---glycerone phosphotransferase subunit DhaL
METIEQPHFLRVIEEISKAIHEKKEYLTELDAAIGDGDHGINMARGFTAVQSKLGHLVNQDIGTILKSVGMTLVSEIGGASGPLYGTAFIEAGKSAQGKTEVDHEDLIAMGEAALAGIKKRGRSERGQKTMIDAIEPALNAFRVANSILEGVGEAVDASRKGMEGTIQMIAKKGRASYLGSRSIGHQDPGATSSALMIDIAYKTLKGGA